MCYANLGFQISISDLLYNVFLFIFTDPNSESKLPITSSLNIYIPRDERFGHLKMSDFLAYALKSIDQVIKTALESIDSTPFEFDTLEDVLKLYQGGLDLPAHLLDDIRKNIPLEMLKEIFRTDGEKLFEFPMPQVIKGIVNLSQKKPLLYTMSDININVHFHFSDSDVAIT